MDRVPLAIAEDLHFDVARLLDIGFGVDAPVAEIALGLAGGDARGLAELGRAAHDAHALAAAARRRLDEQGEAYSFGLGGKAFEIG